MSPAETELDLPLMPNADQIRRREFATARRGYDPDQVREYLRQIADQVQSLEERLREARLEAGRSASSSGDPYQALAGKMADVIRAADEHAERTVREASEEARKILGEARSEADRIRAESQARADEERRESSARLERSRADAERALAGLSVRREGLARELRELRERLLSMAGALPAANGPTIDVTSPDATAEEEPPAPAPEPPEAQEDLWAATEAIRVEIPDIPPFEDDPGAG